MKVATIAAVAWASTFISNALLLAVLSHLPNGQLHWDIPFWLGIPVAMAGLSIALPFRLLKSGRERLASDIAVVFLVLAILALLYCLSLWRT